MASFSLLPQECVTHILTFCTNSVREMISLASVSKDMNESIRKMPLETISVLSFRSVISFLNFNVVNLRECHIESCAIAVTQLQNMIERAVNLELLSLRRCHSQNSRGTIKVVLHAPRLKWFVIFLQTRLFREISLTFSLFFSLVVRSSFFPALELPNLHTLALIDCGDIAITFSDLMHMYPNLRFHSSLASLA